MFMMREWLELETDEICKELASARPTCGCCLHRARLRLRDCLQDNWFGRRADAAQTP
jgi:RNA polymerase sigma-70 factor (ECF subfamily)